MAIESIFFAGKEYMGETLSAKERDILQKSIEYLGSGNDFLTEVLRQNAQDILATAMIAKHELEAPFAGVLTSDPQVGVQLMRPGHIMRDTTATETAINTWDVESIQSGAFTSGADNWIGFGANNATAANVDKEACLLLMGLWFTQGGQPVVEQVRFTIGETVYPVTVLRQSWLADNKNRIRAVRFHPMLAKPKDTIFAEVRSQAAGRMEMALLGLTFGTGRYLRALTYSTIAV